MSLAIGSLTEMLKNCGDEERDIPVMHVPFYANTFPLAFGYYEALSCDLRISSKPPNEKSNILKQKIRTEDWKNEMPRFERSARYNVFFADKDQKDRWQHKETFYYAEIFKYEHKFVLVDKSILSTLYSPSTVPVAPTINDICAKLMTTGFKEIRIVSDIIPEAEKLRKDIVKSVCINLNATTSNTIKSISTVRAKERSLLEVCAPAADVFKIYLFGTPLCEILKVSSSEYVEISYVPNPPKIPTYLCIVSSTPDTVFMPFLHIRHFFADNSYPVDGLTNPTVSLDEVALKFLKYAESSFPAIQETEFKSAFNKSIQDHCTLVNSNSFTIEESE